MSDEKCTCDYCKKQRAAEKREGKKKLIRSDGKDKETGPHTNPRTDSPMPIHPKAPFKCVTIPVPDPT